MRRKVRRTVRRRGEAGLGLVELMIGLAITAMIIVTLGMTLTAVVRNTAASRDQQSATQQLRNALYWLNQDTQSAIASQSTPGAGSATLQWTDYATGTTYSSSYAVVGTELQRTFSVNGAPTTRTIARNVTSGGFSVTQSGAAMTYALSVQNGSGTQSQSETALMRVGDLPITPFPTVTATNTPTSTPTNTPTSTPTDTPTPTATFTGTPTPTDTPTNTPTPTSTPTETPTPTNTPTPTSTPTNTATATPAAWLKTGSYTGNATAGRTISGVGFQPDVVIIRNDNNDTAVIRTSNMPANVAKQTTSGNNLVANLITSFNSDGFVIGSDNDVNQSGSTIYYTAMKTTGANINVGTYTGNGSDNRNITGVGFQPDWVMTLADGEQDMFRPALLGGDASYTFSGTGTNTNRIQSILSDGFQLGSNNDVNESGRAYYWIAFDEGSKVQTGMYTGDGNDNRNITGVGITPTFVWTKRSASSAGVWRTDSVAGDATLYWSGTSPTANRIQSLISDGFQVGTNAQANNSGSTYYYLALTP